ncbi:hypothetical protein [Donghicola tyrosinivorans]|uniref:hypothetical protein n=1 Tax=Donghicola tyrosinivorans TaxID=1652492 RepID=UPI0014745076|nr:hypothetical protein [Donghicola tyrosinivorans]
MPLALAPPEDGALTRATDPSIISPAPSGPSVGYVHQHIKEPMDWRQLNDAQAPGGGT